MKNNFLKYTIVWISQNLAIPFWVVGHVHLSIHYYIHNFYDIISSLLLHVIVAIGFFIDYNEQKSKENGN